tara:strand:+ start:16482 stop:17114 length:633 start_codon:yes stop_codon:yes gene_type:complete
MRKLELMPNQLQAVKNVWESKFAKDFDPAIQYSVVGAYAPEGVEHSNIIRGMGHRTYFSALNSSRQHIADHMLKTDSFPANEFCALSPRTAMLFINGHRSNPKNGDRGYICMVNDRGAKQARSPSVINVGAGPVAARSSSYRTTSASAVLLGVIEVEILSAHQTVTASENDDGNDEDIRFGAQVKDKGVVRKLRKVKRKRKDNFGNKFDY